MSQDKPRPRYTGIYKQIDLDAGYAIWIPTDWRKIDMVNGHNGHIYTPNKYGYDTCISTEKVVLEFTADGVAAIAEAAAEVNRRTENIGARRLHTVMERLLDEVSFEGAERAGERVVVDASYVRERLEEIASDADLSRYVL